MMLGVTTEQKLDAPADQVWTLMGGFNSFANWHPAVETSNCSEVGTMRTLGLAGGGEIIEKLEKFDNSGHQYSYSIVESPLPVGNYNSTLQLIDDGEDSCIVKWSSEFTASGVSNEEAQAVIEGIYKAGFKSLKSTFG